MKQFILKNIVLVVILGLTLVGSIVLLVFCEGKRRTIDQSMKDIEADVQKLESIDSARKPNSVAESETKIKADTEMLSKKTVQIYRHFGKPYRPALLKLLKNIASPAALETELALDPSLVARPKPKVEATEPEDDEEGEEEEVAETKPAEPSEPTDEEKAVFNPAKNLVILSFDEDTLRTMLADLYKEIHQEPSSDDSDTFMIPDTIQSERTQLFEKLFEQIIEAPEAVDSARAEDFRKAAAAKFAKAFAIFREDVQELTLEDVTDRVAHELFLDALGLPRLMRQRDCKNYIDFLYEKYLNAGIIPGLPEDDNLEKERRVQNFIYGSLNRQALPVPDMVIPILRNFQIKEDLFSRMKDAGITSLRSMNVAAFYGSTMDNDAEGPILVFSYTLEMTASMDAVDAFVNSLHSAYKTDRVYEIKDIKFSAPYEDMINANSQVAYHTEKQKPDARRTTTPAAGTAAAETADQQAIQPADTPAVQTASVTRVVYDFDDPRNPEYGQPLIGETQDEIKCTIVVNYLFYRADNITPQ